MENREAIEIFNKWMDCKDAYQADPSCDGNCYSCEYYASAEEEKEAMQMAVSALKFRENYDKFWEEIKSAGMRGKETEIRHSGRVFRIREVAQ